MSDAGSGARAGFEFQDLVLLDRLLAQAVEERRAELLGQARPASPRFLTESPTRHGAPAWDLLTIKFGARPCSLMVEEVKSGAVTKRDRTALWNRIRRTHVAGRPLRVRLTVDSANPPNNVEHWGQLPALAQAASGAVRPTKVSSAEDLACEAVFCLTAPATVDGKPEDHPLLGPPLELAAAHQLLKRFELDATRSRAELEAEVDRQLGLLSRDVGVPALRAASMGYITQVAASKEADFREVSTAQLLSSVDVLRRLVEVDPEAARVLQELRALSSTALQQQITPTSGSALAERRWESVQPAASRSIAAASHQPIALVGAGGIGKTSALWQLARSDFERGGVDALWLDASRLRGMPTPLIGAALDLGAFDARAQDKRLAVYIDALETLDDPLKVAETLARIDSVRLTISCRASVWNASTGSQEAMPGWVTTPLQEWSPDEVTTVITELGHSKPPPALASLLRTPLFLDLFVRAFGASELVADDLSAKHKIMSEYWQRRVLPSGDPRTSKRRRELMRIAAEAAAGQLDHDADADPEAMGHLVSQGLLVLRGGRASFRHDLLRDHALMMWACQEPSAPSVAVRLGSVAGHLARHGALLATLQAVASRAPGSWPPSELPSLGALADSFVVDESSAERLTDALGALDAARSISLDRLATIMHARLPGFDVLTRLLGVASASGSDAWISPLARLPRPAEAMASLRWAKPGFLPPVAGYLLERARAWRSDRAGPPDAPRLAARLRGWSSSPAFAPALDANNGFSWRPLVEAVFVMAPNTESVCWAASIAGRLTWLDEGVLSCLRRLPAWSKRAGTSVNGRDVREAFIAAARLEEREGLLWPTDSDAHWTYRVERTLLDAASHDDAPLLNTYANDLLPAVFALLSGLTARDRAHEEATLFSELDWSELAAQIDLSALPKPAAPPPAIQMLHVRLEAQCEIPPDAGDLGTLHHDLRGDRFWEDSGLYGALARALRDFVRPAGDVDQRAVSEIYWPHAAASRSAVARYLLLESLVGEQEAVLPQVVDEIIRDRRIYACANGVYWLWRAIQARWSDLSANGRDDVIEGIRSVIGARSVPRNGLYRAGQLASAIAADDLPPDLAEFLRLTTFAFDGYPEPTPPSRIRAMVRGATRDPAAEYREHGALSGIEDAAQASWQRIFEWSIVRQPNGSGVVEWQPIFEDLDAVVAHGLPGIAALSARAWPLHHIELALASCQDERWEAEAGPDEQHEPSTPHLSTSTVAALAEWAFDLASRLKPVEVNADTRSVAEVHVDRCGSENLWCQLIRFLDHVLMEPSLMGDDKARGRLFAEVSRMAAGMSPWVARQILPEIRRYHWAQHPDGAALAELLLGSEIRDPDALRWGLDLLDGLAVATKRRILLRWLTAKNALGDQPTDFLKDVAHWLGGRAVHAHQVHTHHWTLSFVEELLAKPAPAGVLAARANHRVFVVGIVFGASQEIGEGGAESGDYADLISDCWRALDFDKANHEAKDDDRRFSFCAFGPTLKNAQSGLDQRRWWTAVEPVARSVALTGPVSEVFDLIFEFHDAGVVEAVGPDTLCGIIEDIACRFESERAADGSLPRGHHKSWWNALELAVEMIEHVASHPRCPSHLRERCCDLLTEWSRGSNGSEGALRTLTRIHA